VAVASRSEPYVAYWIAT